MRLTLTAVSALALTLAACSPPAEKAAEPSATAPAAAPASTDAFAFKIGALDAYALKDGSLSVPNNGEVLAIGEAKADVDALLTANGLPTDTLGLSIQPMLVRMGDKVVLFDTGAGGQMGTEGKLLTSLTAAGVQPAQVTDILISHAHGDHVGGLVNGQGQLVFTNAAIRMTANEWDALKADPTMAALVTAITPKVQTFAAGVEVLPGVTAVDIQGHTPGHTGYQITSGTEGLLYIGDTMHHSVISVQRPDWTIQFDGRADVAEASRRALLERAATENLRLYAVHFPYPGLGRIERRADDFVWVAEPAQ
ncbi:MAG: MBL fold metallo-hydrolase [Brevundimonas sp.]|uniref:MBL fold metallo-hydrolase n=1 Tax=Brevundimonas sp. TaxID=1871086 RepID=UPI001A1A07E0|nr:MBL fold metallo-hydrolase [Brevundimonas sp.]MBJ7446629.1 MBL fold metallo-hydrolase [Brevundimonas sp.]